MKCFLQPANAQPRPRRCNSHHCRGADPDHNPIRFERVIAASSMTRLSQG